MSAGGISTAARVSSTPLHCHRQVPDGTPTRPASQNPRKLPGVSNRPPNSAFPARAASSRPGRPTLPSTAVPMPASRAIRSASALLANGARIWMPSVQVSPAARLPVRRCGRTQRAGRDQARRARKARVSAPPCRSSTTGSSAVAEPLAFVCFLRRRRQRYCFAAVFGRLLLQDLHVAQGGVEEPLRTQDPRRRRSWRRPRPAGSRPLLRAVCPLRMCWCWAAARPASQHLPRPKPACASSLPTSRPGSAAVRVSRPARGSTAATVTPGRSGAAS